MNRIFHNQKNPSVKPVGFSLCKFRVYSTYEQQDKLAVQFGGVLCLQPRPACARSIHQETGTDLTERLKVDHPWLKAADSQAAQQALRDLDKAYKSCFAGRADYHNTSSKTGLRRPIRSSWVRTTNGAKP